MQRPCHNSHRLGVTEGVCGQDTGGGRGLAFKKYTVSGARPCPPGVATGYESADYDTRSSGHKSPASE